MSDWRLCSCGKEIDIEAPGMKVFSSGRSGGRLTVIDPQGQAHSVATRYQSARKRNQLVHALSAEEKGE